MNHELEGNVGQCPFCQQHSCMWWCAVCDQTWCEICGWGGLTAFCYENNN